MPNSLNTTAINEYSRIFSQIICDRFYQQKDIANGQDLLNITAIQQTNLFIIRDLYEKWRIDAENFKSPFFDFDADAVKKAMQSFMNVVSQNIAVKRNDLEPLLSTSTNSTLTLLLAPKNYYKNIFDNLPDSRLTTESLMQIKKYTKINGFVLDTIKEQLGDKNVVSAYQAIDWASEAIDQSTTEALELWIQKFSEITPLNINDFYQNSGAVKMETDVTESSFFDSLPEVAQEATPQPKTPEIVTQNEATEYKEDKRESLNDSLRNEYTSVADNFQKTPLENMSQSISLSQKFMYIHQLFAGSNNAYEVAMAELEAAPSYEKARELIQFKFASQYMWDMTSETVEDLINTVKRRFGA